MSPLKTISGKRSAEISFSVELKGSGTPGEPPKWRHLLRACGFAELPSATDVLYRPTSEAIPSLTIALFEDGLRKTIWGARGTVDFAFTNGTFARMNFTFTGADFEVIDAPLLEGVAYMGTIPPIFMNSTFTVHGFNAVIQQVTFDMANTVALRESVAAAGGHVSAFITSRRPVGTINPEMVSVAAHPFYDEWRDGVEGTLTFSMGGEVGNRIEVTAPSKLKKLTERGYAWLQFTDGVRVKLRYVSPQQFAHWRKIASRRRLRGGRIFEELDESKLDEILSDEVILDWEGITENGQPFPCTPENKRLLMQHWTEFALWVNEQCMRLEAFVQAEQEEEQKKISEPSRDTS